MSPFIVNGLLAAFTSEFSKQSFTLTVSKIFTLLSYFDNGVAGISSISGNSSYSSYKSETKLKVTKYSQSVDEFIKKLFIQAKIETATAIIEDINDMYDIKDIKDNLKKNKAVKLSCQRVHDNVVDIQKELEKLKLVLKEHEQKYFYKYRTPNYESHLIKLENLMEDFEVYFNLLKDSIIVTR